MECNEFNTADRNESLSLSLSHSVLRVDHAPIFSGFDVVKQEGSCTRRLGE